ncbi:uncharacterized protein LOC126898531 [Daktulosphaira vitifoliae]|uniref:uncharacterized protein LOC126898531 n=1 Tax=Daktulosphaira vitifoliae TaxID=58002 RepID=UPI0021AADABE|nr:uncharacterized protein LOC126898531 [Daktulosphaira vitifoliae]
MTEPNDDEFQNTMHIYAEKIKESKNRLESLQSTAEYQKSEIEIKKNKYMDALQQKEIKKIQNEHLCREKARLTKEWQDKYQCLTEYYKKRQKQIDNLPFALVATQAKISEQKKLKTELDKEIESLSTQLKEIV